MRDSGWYVFGLAVPWAGIWKRFHIFNAVDPEARPWGARSPTWELLQRGRLG